MNSSGEVNNFLRTTKLLIALSLYFFLKLSHVPIFLAGFPAMIIISSSKLLHTTLPAATIILFVNSTPYMISDLCPTKQFVPIRICPNKFGNDESVLIMLLSCVQNRTSVEIVTESPIWIRKGSAEIMLEYIWQFLPISIPLHRKKLLIYSSSLTHGSFAIIRFNKYKKLLIILLTSLIMYAL